MSSASFDIIFRGQLQAGCTSAEVKPRLMQLFKADAAKIEALFSGAAIPLKRNLDEASANKYQTILTKGGIVVDVVERPKAAKPVAAVVRNNANTANTGASPEDIRAARLAEQAKRRAARKDAQVNAASSEKALSMAERLAQTELESPAKRDSPAPATEVAENVDDDSVNLTLAAVGADVLKESERANVAPVVVDTSALNLREGGGELLDASEREKDVELDLDLNEYNLAEVGEDLLPSEERVVAAAVEVDISQIELDKPGGELLHEDEKAKVEVAEVNIAAIDLAPTGSDLGQLKEDKPVITPDTSKISLAP